VGSVNCIAEPVICQNWCVPLFPSHSDVLKTSNAPLQGSVFSTTPPSSSYTMRTQCGKKHTATKT
jgi:hypothetical protein